jgi:hypothetical protein
MSRYSEIDTYSQAGDWLAGAARRNPEALLLLAAGACLLMRGRGASSSRVSSRSPYGEVAQSQQSGSAGMSSSAGRMSSNLRDGLSRAADTATDYAAQIKDRVSDTASAYADSVSEFADDARRSVSERSARLGRQAQSTLQGSMDRVLRDQPLAVAVAGLAAGAAVAALFPSTEMEGRTLGGAREALTGAAGKAGEMVMDAAGKASERLKTAAQERGLSSEGLQGLANEVAETFTGAVGGKSGDRESASSVAKSSGANSPASQSGYGASQSFGAGQGKRDTNRSSDMARTNTEPSRGGR